ncbi:MAG: NAD(P)-binding protein [Firmicutes bacterium]|jgi:phytoene dehydrogenase-like protein|nr:NAD(P)-binding protein [Bacillota bacterium]
MLIEQHHKKKEIREMKYDVIVMGAGHNGLVAAAYLAKAGYKPVVVEKYDVIGGAARTEEIHPGFWGNTACLGILFWFREEIIEDLELKKFGLELTRSPEPMATMVFPDGTYLRSYADPQKTAEEFGKFVETDREAYLNYAQNWGLLKQFIDPAMMRPPIPIEKVISGLSASPKGKELAGRLFFKRLRDYLDDIFESEKVKTFMSVFGLDGSPYGPSALDMASSTFHTIMGTRYQYVKGGIGNIPKAIGKAAESYGATIRTSSPVKRILVEGEKVTGVELDSGEILESEIVVSNADTSATFLDAMDPKDLPSDFLRMARERDRRFKGTMPQINIAMSELPDFGIPEECYEGGVLFLPSLDAAEKSWFDYTRGEIPEEPFVWAIAPSVLDDTIAPRGKHIFMFCPMPWPYKLARGTWDERKEESLEKALNYIERFDPKFRQKIIHTYINTPLDLERKMGLRRGDVFHATATWDNLLDYRPFPGYSDYRTPVKGLYLCGGDCHPGAGIGGMPGHNAAMAVLEDLKKK